jgi:hypothetical protein
MKTADGFSMLVHRALATTRARELLACKRAVVLERIARGGGATDWYYCPGTAELDLIERRLRPGSVVSFYFDDRIRKSRWSDQLKLDIAQTIVETGDAVFGVLGTDGIEISVDIVVSVDELDELGSTLSLGSEVFWGAFPGRDNDGERAVTLTLADRDGVVRPHPH